jgi:hypothetical protein
MQRTLRCNDATACDRRGIGWCSCNLCRARQRRGTPRQRPSAPAKADSHPSFRRSSASSTKRQRGGVSDPLGRGPRTPVAVKGQAILRSYYPPRRGASSPGICRMMNCRCRTTSTRSGQLPAMRERLGLPEMQTYQTGRKDDQPDEDGQTAWHPRGIGQENPGAQMSSQRRRSCHAVVQVEALTSNVWCAWGCSEWSNRPKNIRVLSMRYIVGARRDAS